MSLKPQLLCRLTATTLAMVVVIGGAVKFGLPGASRLSTLAFAATLEAPVYHANPVPPALEQTFIHNGYKLDVQSGNYLGPRLSAKTLHEPLVPVLIDGKYVRDARGQPVYLRKTMRDELEAADLAMFQHKKEHLRVVYGFRPNVLQEELYKKLNGHAKVAPPGMSFHETGMAVDLGNWRDAQKYMIEAGFVGGCFGLEEDMVHYSVNEINKVSNVEEFKRCTFKEIPEDVLKAAKKVGIGVERFGDFITDGHFPGAKKTTN